MGSTGDEATGDEEEADMLRGDWGLKIYDERMRNVTKVFL
jgi:hypothetical protein